MLDDKYRIERLLATGGMGAVYVGTHVGLRKRVAIKILNPQMNSAAMIERFHREAVTASQIGHEGIAQVTDLGTSSEGEPFLVMEYLDGESLASRIRAVRIFAIDDACELGCAILAPLAAAHRAGIVHRDLKPDNVFLVRQSRGEIVKLLDFGISRAAGQESNFRLTTTGLVLGTPYYMSPEQARGESVVTPAADLYAFGVILYEMLVGEVPIRADNYNALMYRVTIGDYIPPRVRRSEIPEALEYLIMRAMASTPAERPASAGELEQALLPFCRAAFRDHATGRIAVPRVALQTPPHPAYRTDRNASFGSFSGTTLSDGPPELRPITGLRTDERTTTEVDPVRASPSQPALAVPPAPATPAALPVAMSPLAIPPAAATPATTPRRTRSRIAVVVALAAAAALAGTLAIVLSGSTDSSSAAASPATTTAPTLATPPPAGETREASEARPTTPEATPSVAEARPSGGDTAPAPPAPATITVRLAVDPASATVTLDNAPVASGQLTLPRDGALHRLRITAPGYQGYDESLQFDESQRLVVALKRTAVPSRGKPARKDRDPDGIDSQSPYH
jgi:serine/threonine-protein kinase